MMPSLSCPLSYLKKVGRGGGSVIVLRIRNGQSNDSVIFSNGRVMKILSLGKKAATRCPKRRSDDDGELKNTRTTQRLNLTSHTAQTKVKIKLNGENYLLVDSRSPPSLIIGHRKGVEWRKEKNFIQKNGDPMYGGEYMEGQQNTCFKYMFETMWMNP